MHRLSAIELRDKFIKGEYSASEIVHAFLERIEKYDKKIGAFLHVYKERSLKHAKKLDKKLSEGNPLGLMAGIPVAIKDNIHIKGELTTCASKILSNYQAPFTATVVELLEAEDAIIIGKTNLDEFAMGSSTENSAFQKTYNPWNLKCTPGGSSGGSSAAVAARLCPVALGSDTGGSIRQPAAFCGVVGFKPTYGCVSRHGLVAFGSSLDQIGPLTINTSDAALTMEVIGKKCKNDPTSLQRPPEGYLNHLTGNIKGWKIGIPWSLLKDLEEEPKKLFQQSIDVFKSLGALCVDIHLDVLKKCVPVYYIIATSEASFNLSQFEEIRDDLQEASYKNYRFDQSNEKDFGPEVKRRMLLGKYVTTTVDHDDLFQRAQKMRNMIIQSYEQAFGICDLIATPVSPFAAFEIGAVKDPEKMYLEDIYTIPANLAGVPAISIPNGFTRDKKPVGLQLIAPQKKDVRVFQGAYAFEKATEYYKILPKVR